LSRYYGVEVIFMARANEKSDLWAVVEVMEVTQGLKGKSFSITGHMGVPRPRVIKIIEMAGGRFEERPRYGTNYLITNRDWNTGTTVDPKKSSKLIEAEKNRIKVISEDEFCQMIIDGASAEEGA